MNEVLSVRDLSVAFPVKGAWVDTVDRVSWTVDAGKTLVIVGESGSGKSISAKAVMGVLPTTARISSGGIRLGGREVLSLSPRAHRKLRGREIAMVSQDPQTSLNPCFTVGSQVSEMIRVHRRTSRRDASRRAVEMLAKVQIADPEARARQYPHEFSGGMRQRVLLAMALSAEPKVLIADEPTTALDATVQAQVLELLRALQRDTGMAIVLITHDFGVVSSLADDVAVMYAGRVVESGSVQDVLVRPRHPYTAALLAATPRLGNGRMLPQQIPGTPPSIHDFPSGCRFHPRCARAKSACSLTVPVLETVSGLEQTVACFHPLQPQEPSNV
ncbi:MULTISPECIES: ABC transporter ATP-binding protein [unclassified Beijerinckia]|uniref:ABC transporter ATP-binding protein n=1 Tax=unclassified Beijerinckia TaxID=2638183 RepID=UPI0008956BB2|nr:MULTISPECIES: ABC transporter ATP-binding protein [unclassified Beijerinckia]MDH7798821.1 oligopeptide/dipeptide ABC transporter ATP-binding protein [Beijerinckia sp. GAS462]SED89773.1 peptide/nickel transport system ATP-binding protein/peptide/nickel transport system ATP-binding protein/dipeptide transport system ATP-binding protein/oligopeptide transport system ATP-binding protein [Beijerinckia sp. 28-YEA-48]